MSLRQATEVSENRRYSYRRKVETFKVPKVVEAGAVPAMIHYVFEVRPSLKFADLSLQKGLRCAPDTLPFVETLAFGGSQRGGRPLQGSDQRKCSGMRMELPQLVQPLVKQSRPLLVYFKMI